MSESLRDLVVTLSLNSDNFTKNIKSVSAQIKEAQSEFTLAAAGIDKFDQSLNGMKTRLSSLNQQYSLQNKAVEQHRRALSAAETKLEKSVEANRKLSDSLTEAKGKYSDIQTEIERFTKAYDNAVRTMGKDTADQLFGDSLADLKKQAADAGEEIKNLEGKLKVSSRTMQNNADAVTKASTAYNNAQAAARKMKAEMDDLERKIKTQSSGWYTLSQSLENFSKKSEKFGKSASAFGKSATAALTVPIATAATAVTKASIDYETAFTSVRKTVNATEGEFAELSNQIKQMSTEVATDAADIAEVFAIAGQMGIETENLAEFARVMIDLGNSTDIVAEDAAASLSQFKNITGMTSDNFDRLGSTLVDLGNKFATTESRVMDMALRLSGAGAQIGMTEPEILAFAAALSSVGIEAEMGGSALSKAMVQMEVAVATGSDALGDFARVSGMTEQAFAAMWDSDPAGALMEFLSGLAKMDDEGISAIATLEEIGIKEIRLRDTLLRSTNAVELLSRTQQVANQAWEENIALTNEANRRYATTESRAKNLLNRYKNIGATLGDDMNPAIHSAMGELEKLAASFENMDQSTRMSIIQLAGAAAAIGPVALGVGKLSEGFSKSAKHLKDFSEAVAKAGGGLDGLTDVVLKSPVAWAAMAAGFFLAIDAIKDFHSKASLAEEGITAMNDAADRWKRTQAETIYDNEGMNAFELSREDFVKSENSIIKDAQAWKTGLLDVWNDGKKETKSTVKEWTESFKALNVGVRTELQGLKDNADKYGYSGVSAALQGDIDKLDSMDKEIEKLLKKRQNRNLSEKEQNRLNELLEQREAIVIKYRLEPEGETTGYQQILDQLEKDEQRAEATGGKVSIGRYAEATKAAAQGYAEIKDSIDDWYDAEYDVVRMIENEQERSEAKAALDRRYNEERKKAAEEYAKVLQETSAPLIGDEDFQKTDAQMDTLAGKLTDLSALVGEDKKAERNTLIGEIGKEVENLDEGQLASYYAMLSQIQSLYKDGGMEKGDVVSLFGIDPEEQMKQLGQITKFAEQYSELKGLNTMLGEALGQEVQTIMIDLDMTQAAERWGEFAENPGALTAKVETIDATGAVIDPPITTNAEIGSLSLTGNAISAWNAYTSSNPVGVSGSVTLTNLSEDLQAQISAGMANVFIDGQKVTVTPEVLEKISNSDVLATPNAEGGIDLIVVPKIQGTTESVEKAADTIREMVDKDVAGNVSMYSQTAMQDIELITEQLKLYNKENKSFWESLAAPSKSGLEQYLNLLDSEEIVGIQAYMQEAFSAIANGEDLLPEDLNLLQSLTAMITEMDTAGVGEEITAGIKAGMEGYDWTNAATVLGTDIVTAFKTALGIQSPSTVMRDQIGVFVPQGLESGMLMYPLGTAANTLANTVITTLRGRLTMSAFTGIGKNVSAGIAAGIRAGIPQIEAAARAAANAASKAAKITAQIHSPSRVAKNEIGIPWSQGVAVGIEEEAKRQEKAIARAMTSMADASTAAFSPSSYQTNKTYNQTSNASVNVQNLYVSDQQDVYSLALEIASLVKRQNRGRGM